MSSISKRLSATSQRSRDVLRQVVVGEVRVYAGACPRVRLCAMCRVLDECRSECYGWLREPTGARDRADPRPLERIKHFWLASGGVDGHRKINCDLREAGELCRRIRYEACLFL